MGTSSYSSSFGRLQALSTNFLSKDQFQNLLKSENIVEMTKMLESTWYGPEIEKAASVYSPPELLEVALNRHLVEVNRIALDVVPYSGKEALKSYLLKWDIHNIELILSSKITGHAIGETEHFLVSSRNFPAGITAGNISHDEMKIILAQNGVDGVINYLMKYKYGTILMQRLDSYQKTGDMGPMMADLNEYYYKNLLESLKFFQGDEGIIREYFRTQIDKRNIMILLKGKDSNLDRDIISNHLVEGGNIPTRELLDIFTSKDIEEFVTRFEERLKLGGLHEHYMKSHSLIDFEVFLDKHMIATYVSKLKNISLSIGPIFYFLITAENERDNIKKIAYGKRYNFSNDRINAMLI